VLELHGRSWESLPERGERGKGRGRGGAVGGAKGAWGGAVTRGGDSVTAAPCDCSLFGPCACVRKGARKEKREKKRTRERKKGKKSENIPNLEISRKNKR
jgi:hypothetical protein